MALQKKVVDIPLGGGESEDVHKHLLPSPRVAAAKNVRLDKAGTYRKRRGIGWLPAGSLPTDTTGINVPFEYKKGAHLLSRRGVFAWASGAATWKQSDSRFTAPVEIINEYEIHSARMVYATSCEGDSNYRVEVWADITIDNSASRVWYQVRDEGNGTVIRRAQALSADVRWYPQVVKVGAKYYIFGFETDPGVGVGGAELRYHEYDPATDTLGAFATYGGGVSNYDVVGNGSEAIVAVAKFAGNPYVDRWGGPSTGVIGSKPLAATADNGSIAVQTNGSFVAVISSRKDVVGTEASLQLFDMVLAAQWNIAQVFQLWRVIGAPSDDTERVTVGFMQSGDVFAAASSAPSKTATVTSGKFPRTKWRVFAKGTGVAQTAEHVLSHVMLAAHVFTPADHSPFLLVERWTRYGDEFRGVTAYGTTNAQPMQRYALLLTIDDESFVVDPETGVETSVYGAFPVIVARINGGESESNQGRVTGNMPRAYYEGTSWRLPTLIVTEAIGTRPGAAPIFAGRARNMSIWNAGGLYKRNVGVRIWNLKLSNPHVDVREINGSALINLGYAHSYDGQLVGENTPVSMAEIVAVTETYGVTSGFLFYTTGDPNVTVKFAAYLELVDRAGAVHRSGPMLFWDFPATDTGVVAELGLVTQGSNNFVNFDIKFLMPELSMYRGRSGVGFRVRVFISVAGSPLTEVLVQPVEIPIPNENSTADTVTVTLDKDSRVDNVADWLAGSGRLGASWPYATELPPEAPPPFVSFTISGNRVFALSAENSSELWISKRPRARLGVEFNPALNVVFTTEKLTGVAAIDEKIVVMSDKRIYAMTTSNMSDDGSGLPPEPQLISTDTGCVDRRSIAEGPYGVIFRGNRGFYLVTRGLSVEYIGGPMEDTLGSASVSSSIVVEHEHEVRITSGSLMLVYHYRRGEWSVRDAESVGVAMIDGRYYISKDTSTGYAVAAERLASDADYADVNKQASGIQVTNVLDIETGWIKLAGLQGLKRVYKVLVLGEYRDLMPAGAVTEGKIKVQLAYNYDDTWIDTRTWDVNYQPLSGVIKGDPFQLEVRPSLPKCEAIKIRVLEVAAEGVVPVPPLETPLYWGEGVVISGIALEVGVKPGAYRFPGRRA